MIFLLPLLTQAGESAPVYPRVFTYEAPAGTKTVNLAGTFNNWSASDTPMHEEADGRTWTITLQLTAGEYQYKYVVNGQTWIPDPKGVNKDDGNGNTNTFITILPPDYAALAKTGDDKITVSALKHSRQFPYLNWQKTSDGGSLQLELRVRPGDISQVSVLLGDGHKVSMVPAATDSIFEFEQTALPWDGKGTLQYSFELVDGGSPRFFGPKGLTASPTGNEFSISLATYHPVQPPSWPARSVIYQIFPDRFDDGNKMNDAAGAPSWNSAKDYSNWLGGDLAGVRKRVGYLKSLGISAIYFNPIFETSSYHGYETVDYKKIDPHFGTNDGFESLTRELRTAGIRTILDGVFNHTARGFFAFKQAKADGPKSPYWDWYSFFGYPVVDSGTPNYKAFYGFPSMPKLNHSNPAVVKFLDSIPQYWNDHADIAGWRLDAANEVPLSFWKQFSAAVRRVNPSAWIIGENWSDSSQYVNSGAWDSAMNYPFLFAVWDFVGVGGSAKPSKLAQTLQTIYNWYPPQVDLNMMNLIDSHDTARILTQCGGNEKLRNIAAAIEFAWPGVPTVYYGDEIGMPGGKDPDNRNPMNWSKATSANPTLAYYRTLIAARRSSPELQEGWPVVLAADDSSQTFAFARVYAGKAAYCLVNRSDRPTSIQIKVPTNTAGQVITNLTTGQAEGPGPGGMLSITVPAMSATILLPKSEADAARALVRQESASMAAAEQRQSLKLYRHPHRQPRVLVSQAHRLVS